MFAEQLKSRYGRDINGVRIVEKPEIEWINTVQAAEILQVGSTQAVRGLMERHPEDLPGINVGSDEQPRWLLKRSDVETFQKNRTPPESG